MSHHFARGSLHNFKTSLKLLKDIFWPPNCNFIFSKKKKKKKKCNNWEPEFFFSQNNVELIFDHVTVNFIYRPNFLQEKRICSGIWKYDRR